MKTFNFNIAAFTTLMLLVTIGSTASIGGALLANPLEKNVPAPAKRTEAMGTAVGGAGNVTPLTGDSKYPQKLSCWQNGELILDLPVIAPRNKVTDLRLLHSAKHGGDMVALDFTNAFCFIK